MSQIDCTSRVEPLEHTEHSAPRPPPPSLGSVGDIFLDTKTPALYGRLVDGVDGWKIWPGPKGKSTPVVHPSNPDYVLNIYLGRIEYGWLKKSTLTPRMVGSASELLKQLLKKKASSATKRKATDSGVGGSAAKRPRLSDSVPAGSTTESVTAPPTFSTPPSSTKTNSASISNPSLPRSDAPALPNPTPIPTTSARVETLIAPVTHEAPPANAKSVTADAAKAKASSSAPVAKPAKPRAPVSTSQSVSASQTPPASTSMSASHPTATLPTSTSTSVPQPKSKPKLKPTHPMLDFSALEANASPSTQRPKAGTKTKTGNSSKSVSTATSVRSASISTIPAKRPAPASTSDLTAKDKGKGKGKEKDVEGSPKKKRRTEVNADGDEHIAPREPLSAAAQQKKKYKASLLDVSTNLKQLYREFTRPFDTTLAIVEAESPIDKPPTQTMKAAYAYAQQIFTAVLAVGRQIDKVAKEKKTMAKKEAEADTDTVIDEATVKEIGRAAAKEWRTGMWTYAEKFWREVGTMEEFYKRCKDASGTPLEKLKMMEEEEEKEKVKAKPAVKNSTTNSTTATASTTAPPKSLSPSKSGSSRPQVGRISTKFPVRDPSFGSVSSGPMAQNRVASPDPDLSFVPDNAIGNYETNMEDSSVSEPVAVPDPVPSTTTARSSKAESKTANNNATPTPAPAPIITQPVLAPVKQELFSPTRVQSKGNATATGPKPGQEVIDLSLDSDGEQESTVSAPAPTINRGAARQSTKAASLGTSSGSVSTPEALPRPTLSTVPPSKPKPISTVAPAPTMKRTTSKRWGREKLTEATQRLVDIEEMSMRLGAASLTTNARSLPTQPVDLPLPPARPQSVLAQREQQQQQQAPSPATTSKATRSDPVEVQVKREQEQPVLPTSDGRIFIDLSALDSDDEEAVEESVKVTGEGPSGAVLGTLERDDVTVDRRTSGENEEPPPTQAANRPPSSLVYPSPSTPGHFCIVGPESDVEVEDVKLHRILADRGGARADTDWGSVLAEIGLVAIPLDVSFDGESWRQTAPALREYYLQHLAPRLIAQDPPVTTQNISPPAPATPIATTTLDPQMEASPVPEPASATDGDLVDPDICRSQQIEVKVKLEEEEDIPGLKQCLTMAQTQLCFPLLSNDKADIVCVACLSENYQYSIPGNTSRQVRSAHIETKHEDLFEFILRETKDMRKEEEVLEWVYQGYERK
ncbi:hypothetical protein C8F01DRAFT_1135459 [Mycena amicta]|nr:hypothetical protein C8F01DRAFT_1135459 [Mycena amicta]